MGLLDDAIREHLELKRRSGADPSSVARAEQEALAPVFPDEANSTVADGHEDALGLDQMTPVDTSALPPSSTEDPRLASFSALDQATAELDMRAVLNEEPDADTAIGSIDAGATAGEPTGGAHGSDLDWRFPEEATGEPAPEDALGQERLTFE